MPIAVPKTRSFLDPITEREEIWLEEGESNGTKQWLRCRITGPIEQRGGILLAPVEIQRCVQKIRVGAWNKIRELMPMKEPSNSLSIPDENGSLGKETATPRGERILDIHLAWGSGSLKDIQDATHVSTHGAISLLKLKAPERKPDVKDVIVNKPTIKQGRFQNENNIELATLSPKERIGIIENGLEEFEKILLSKIQSLRSERPALKTAMQNPFHFVRGNKSNPLKYYGDAAKMAAEQGVNAEKILFSMPEPFCFSYAFKEDFYSEIGFMAYAPLLRTLIMNDFRSCRNYLDVIAFMHEIVHCMHSAQQRRNQMDAYLRFANLEGNPRKVVLNEEFDAYAVELEAFNLILDD